jgi:hypothetical protein
MKSDLNKGQQWLNNNVICHLAASSKKMSFDGDEENFAVAKRPFLHSIK